jgi:GNAT superfamily N-acetyltransferase
MKRAWTSRWITKDDLGKLEEFRRTIGNGDIYSRAEMADYYEWKYFTGAPDPACVAVADDGGKIVGMTAATIKRVAIRGKVVRCAEIGDAFAHPDYRNQGMFTTLGREVVAELAERGIDFVYARPNANSYPGFVRKFGFENAFYLKTIRRVVNLDNIIRNKTGGGALYSLCRPVGSVLMSTVYRISEYRDLPNLAVSEISSFDKRVDELTEKVSADYDVMFVRDAEYLTWRYVQKPVDYGIFAAVEGEGLRGYVVVRCIEFEEGRRKFGYVVDLLTGKHDADAVTLLLGKAMQYFTDERVDFATTWIIRDSRPEVSAYYRGLKNAGFGRAGEDLYFVVRTEAPEIKKLVHETVPADWFFRMGDTDGI